jgi:hypothetical protein
MPGATPSIQKANHILSGSDSGAKSDALEAVTGAASILDAIDNLQFLADIEEEFATEVRAVLTALPEPIDHAFLAAIKSALGSGAPVTLAWKEEEVIGLRVSESAGEISIVLSTPHGTTFVS